MYNEYTHVGQQFCIAALAAVCEDDICAIKIQKDPTIQQSEINGVKYAAAVQISLSNHKHTTAVMNSNSTYYLGGDDDDDDTEESLSFPGNVEVPTQDFILMKEVSQSVQVSQNLCVQTFHAGKGNLVKDVLSKVKSAAKHIKDGLAKIQP